MLAVGGLRTAAKRTAFGDVTNTAKTASVHDESAGKSFNLDERVVKPVIAQDKSAAFLRPAQRPLNVNGTKGPVNNTSSIPNESTIQPLSTNAPLRNSRQPQPANNRPSTKRGPTIYNDNADNEQKQQQSVPAPQQDSVPTAPVRQNLGPRHIKSHPQLKQDPSILHPNHEKETGIELEAQILDSSIEAIESYMGLVNQKNEAVQEGVKSIHSTVDLQYRQLPAPPLVSEPEEYWEEEEVENYDDQGYTTAHSYRSRGDNTTGGATTVLFPKVTNKAKKELAAAKELVESARTAEDIEDELWDTSMVAEYGDEIFAYMRELEVSLRTLISRSLPGSIGWH
jgi:hypothetical protein